jgi:hypothetical protein
MVMDGLVDWAGEALPHFALHLGDMAHMDGTDGEFTANECDMYASILGRMTLWPAIGNHEGHSLSSATQTRTQRETMAGRTAAVVGRREDLAPGLTVVGALAGMTRRRQSFSFR